MQTKIKWEQGKNKKKPVMNTINYKGFLGSVCFSEKDGLFFGKIEGIDGLVNFEGESVSELTDSFHAAVDDFIIYCEQEGLPLHKSYTGNLNIRISPETHRKLAIMAKIAGISLNALISQSLELVSKQ